MSRRTSVSLMWPALVLAWAANAADAQQEANWWPQFHGPRRDNISTETGLLKTWPESGPKLLWASTECGHGYSGVAIAHEKIFTVGDFEQAEQVVALDLSGRLLWRTTNGPTWDGPHPGSRTTPTFVDGVLYHLNPTGRIAALRADSGQELWAVDLVKKFGARYGTWALSENLLVDDDLVVCVPGGPRALIVALDRRSGKTVWTNAALDQTAAYCSPALTTIGGVRQLVTVVQKSIVGLDVRTGKLLWSHPRNTPHDQNVTMPIIHEGKVFVASGHGGGGEVIRIPPDFGKVESIWSNPEFDNCHGGALFLHGRLYGSGCRQGGRSFFCADFDSGKIRFVDSSVDKLSVTAADDMIYGIDQNGRMYLIRPATDRLQIASRFRVPKGGRGPFFAHPVVCGGRLYVRHDQTLYAYNVKNGGPQP